MDFQKLNTGLGLNLNPKSQLIVKSAAKGAAAGVVINAIWLGALVAITLATRK